MLTKNYTSAYKGIAILCIVICHAIGMFSQGSIRIHTPLGGVGVAIFLLLSAYGLNTSWEKSASVAGKKPPYKCWWRKRFVTVWIPYIIVQLVAYWPFHKLETIPFLLDMTLIKPRYQYGWYLQYLLIWYTVFYVVRRMKILNRCRIPVFAITSTVLFFTLQEIKAEQSLSFITGIILSERTETQNNIFKLGYGLLFTAFGIAGLAIKQLPVIRTAPQLVMNITQLSIKLPIGLGMIILCGILIRHVKWIGKTLGKVGVIAYELYLIHGYILRDVPLSIIGGLLFASVTSLLSVSFWRIMRRVYSICYQVFRIE